jgi:hypothetical protein
MNIYLVRRSTNDYGQWYLSVVFAESAREAVEMEPLVCYRDAKKV